MHGCLNCGKFISMDWEPMFPDFCNYGCKFDYNDRGGPAVDSEQWEKNLQETYKAAHEKWLKNEMERIRLKKLAAK